MFGDEGFNIAYKFPSFNLYDSFKTLKSSSMHMNGLSFLYVTDFQIIFKFFFISYRSLHATLLVLCIIKYIINS